jgi:cellulose synthase/poly-beta-1,6-N-acetylglucosamine synthase-like glycosyltransferase
MMTIIWLVKGFNYFVVVYYGFINITYSLLLIASLMVIFKHLRRLKYSSHREYTASPKTPPVSVLIPVFNEENVVVETVKSALLLEYPYYEVIIINDGSTDKTLKTITEALELKKIDLVYRPVLKTKTVKAFYYNPKIPNLLLIDKENGGKADALNCGINKSGSPYFCSVDADSVLERDALLRLMSNVIESDVPLIASGGVVRALNGSRVKRGEVVEVDLPKTNLPLFQIVEYLRAFLFGRVGLDFLKSTLILSGTFALFNKAAVIEIGGYKTKSIAEDMELVVNLHRHFMHDKKKYKIRFISDPVCWTVVPENLSMLARQRRRWHLGLVQTLMEHRSMLFNSHYGAVGMFGIPYYFLVEMLSPVIEVVGYFVVFCSYLLGLVSVDFMLLFMTFAVLYAVFLSMSSVFLEELSFRRYPRWSHLVWLLAFAVFENFGYRQLNSFWRFQGVIKYMKRDRRWEAVLKKRTA